MAFVEEKDIDDVLPAVIVAGLKGLSVTVGAGGAAIIKFNRPISIDQAKSAPELFLTLMTRRNEIKCPPDDMPPGIANEAL